jgi:hypothetical protein
MRLIKTTGLVLIGTLTLAGCATGVDTDPEALSPSVTSTETASPTPTASETETDTETEILTDEQIILEALMGPDGEYAALASYQAVLDEYGQVEPYATILAAEARHADALIRQLERLGVEVPENPYLGLIEAPADLQSAAEAWAEGEILNVELYDYLLTQTDDSQLTKVLNNLRSASLDSHLPAFQAAAENGGTLDSMTGVGHSN